MPKRKFAELQNERVTPRHSRPDDEGHEAKFGSNLHSPQQSESSSQPYKSTRPPRAKHTGTRPGTSPEASRSLKSSDQQQQLPREITDLLKQTTNQLVKRLQAARGIERQKLGRRLKTAQQEQHQHGRDQVRRLPRSAFGGAKRAIRGAVTKAAQEEPEADDDHTTSTQTNDLGNDQDGLQTHPASDERKSPQMDPSRAMILRLDREVEELRRLDLAHEAELHLFKALCRTSRKRTRGKTNDSDAINHTNGPIQEGPVERRCQTLLAKGGTWSVEKGNVLGRLFKVPAICKAVAEFVAVAKGRLPVVDARTQHEGSAERQESSKDTNGGLGLSWSDDEFDGFSDRPAEDAERNLNERDKQDNQDGGDDLVSSGDEVYDKYAARLAISESDSEESLAEDLERPPRNKEEQEISEDEISLSDSDEDSDNTSSKQRSTFKGDKIPRPSSSLPPPAASRPSTTTFLPSLSMGGYYSGSESGSDPSPAPHNDLDNDDDTDNRSTGAKARLAREPRRNRMGQQARRALWEKKYKDRANHLHDETGGRGKDRGKSSDKSNPNMVKVRDNRSRKARSVEEAKGGSGHGGFGRGGQQTSGNQAKRRPRQEQQRQPQQRTKPPTLSEEKLHPSWEAAKKARELKKGIGVHGTGKKTVF